MTIISVLTAISCTTPTLFPHHANHADAHAGSCAATAKFGVPVQCCPAPAAWWRMDRLGADRPHVPPAFRPPQAPPVTPHGKMVPGKFSDRPCATLCTSSRCDCICTPHPHHSMHADRMQRVYLCTQPPHVTAGPPVALHQRRQEDVQTAEMRLHVPSSVEVQDHSRWQALPQRLLQQLNGSTVEAELVLQGSKATVCIAESAHVQPTPQLCCDTCGRSHVRQHGLHEKVRGAAVQRVRPCPHRLQSKRVTRCSALSDPQ